MKIQLSNIVKSRKAFMLVELMTASAVGLMLFGGMLVTVIAQQRGFIAALYEMDSQADESRVLAYLSRDLRDATAVQISAQGTEVTITVPVSSSAPTMNLNLGLPLLSLLSTSTTPPATSTITYYREGTAIMRQVGSATTQLSSSATNFQVSRSGAMVTTTVQFQPSFSICTNTDAAAASQVASSTYLLNASLP